ncbi:MAG: BON domain-containing protein [Gammaproteobacteria bacterium]
MLDRYLRIGLLLMLIPLLHACAVAVVAGGATGVTVAHDRRTTGTFIEDQAIELKANKGFYTDKELYEQAHLNVTSYNTVVLVTGETPSEELRNRAIDIVRNIPKVTHVHNEITIAAPSAMVSRSSDTLITTKVKTKLLTVKGFDGTRTKVVTEKGVVYLMGLLTREKSDIATNIVRQVGGVQKVVKLFQYTN